MRLVYEDMTKIADLVADRVLKALKKNNLGKGGNSTANEGGKSRQKTAYQKTEQLLYNYRGFKKIIQEKLVEIEELKANGVPKRSASISAYCGNTGTVGQLVLPEESVESAVQAIQQRIVDTVQAIDTVDKALSTLKGDPYYGLLEMLYFEGRTQEDIALAFNCSQGTVSNNRNRLVRELAMQIFPDQVANELLG